MTGEDFKSLTRIVLRLFKTSSWVVLFLFLVFYDAPSSIIDIFTLLFPSCPGGSDTQTPCGAGTYNAASGSSAASDCLSCNATQLSNGASASCTECPAGYSCSGNVQTACSSGQYAEAGVGVCSSCPSGMICPTQTNAPQVRLNVN